MSSRGAHSFLGPWLVGIVSLATACGSGDTAPDPDPDPDPPVPPSLGGVPDGMCGAGFEHDEDGGCAAILPSEPCPPGLMAVPGEPMCRPVAPCGEGTWGDIPVDATTQHVDAQFVGTSDGSAGAPWATIAAGVAAAAPGAIVAVAEGTYVGDLLITAKPVRILGRCPELVEIVGTGGLAAVDLRTGVSGSEIARLAVRGPTIGVLLSGSENVVLDRVWIHDNESRGVDAESALGATSLTVRDSLVEANARTAVFVAGAAVTVERSLLRDAYSIDPTGGKGLLAQVDMLTGLPSAVHLSGSLVERNADGGIGASGSELLVESTVVRDTQLGDGGGGIGISIQEAAADGRPAAGTVRTSVLTGNGTTSLLVSGGQALVERTTISDTLTAATGNFGRGLGLQSGDVSNLPSTVTVVDTKIARNVEVGLYVAGANADIDGLLVLATTQDATGLYGDGVSIVYDDGAGLLDVSGSRIDDNVRAGIANFGSDVLLGASVLSCNAFALAGEPLGERDAVFDDLGDNRCGCPTEEGGCAVQSTSIGPPDPIEQ